MRIEHLTHPNYDQALAAEIADIERAAAEVDSPHLEPRTVDNWYGYLMHGWDLLGVPHVFVARDDAGAMLGYVRLDLPVLDNTSLIGIDMTTDPSIDDERVDDALYDEVIALARDVNRPQLVCGTWRDTRRAAFWERHGFTVASTAAQRRLLPGKLDWPKLDELHAQSLERSAEYEVIEMASPVPPEHIEGVLDLQLTMNDAPLDDLDIEDMVWPEERYRDHEEAMVKRGIRRINLVARRRSDGAYAGFTVIEIEDERLHLGFQDDTAVVGEHRGNRLGLRLKIEMLQLLRDRHPQLTQIDTWNAESNAFMISVNEAIGCFVVGRVVELQKHLD